MLDVASAYHHVEVEPESRDFTAFASPFGSFRYRRMPFGLKNAGATYCRMVDRMLANFEDEPDTASFRWGLTISDSLRMMLQLQSLPESSTYLCGKPALRK